MGRHAIIVIKNEDKYLQYYEEKWDSYLFLNTKIESKENINPIKEYLKEKLNITNVDIKYINERIHTKFSVKDKIEKEYDHLFYLVKVNEEYTLPDNFKWFTMEELLNDKRIQEVNSDVVGYIKELNI